MKCLIVYIYYMKNMTIQNSTFTKAFSIKLDPKILSLLREKAIKNERTINWEIRYLLKDKYNKKCWLLDVHTKWTWVKLKQPYCDLMIENKWNKTYKEFLEKLIMDKYGQDRN